MKAKLQKTLSPISLADVFFFRKQYFTFSLVKTSLNLKVFVKCSDSPSKISMPKDPSAFSFLIIRKY